MPNDTGGEPERLPGQTDEGFDLDSPELYLNRELTWLNFNRRVLHEAQDTRTPLLERVKFLAIVSSNLDEFFMKRVGGLKQQLGAGVHELSVDGRTPLEQLAECHEVVRDLKAQQRDLAVHLTEQLSEVGIWISRYYELGEAEQAELREYYLENIFPLVTPIAMDPAHPFPFISNLSLNLLVSIVRSDGKGTALARIKVPIGKGVPRFLQIGESTHFVPLEDVIAHNLDLLFPGVQIERWDVFRVTRTAITELSLIHI